MKCVRGGLIAWLVAWGSLLGQAAQAGDLFEWRNAKVDFGLVRPDGSWDPEEGRSAIVDMTMNEDGSQGHWDLFRVRFDRRLLGRDDPVFASGWVRSKVGEDRSVMLGKNGRIKIGGEEFSVRNKMTRECSESSGCSRVLTIDGVSPSGLKMRIVATGNSRE